MSRKITKEAAAALPRDSNALALQWFGLSDTPPPLPVKRNFTFGHVAEEPGETKSFIFPVSTHLSAKRSKENARELFQKVLVDSVKGHLFQKVLDDSVNGHLKKKSSSSVNHSTVSGSS